MQKLSSRSASALVAGLALLAAGLAFRATAADEGLNENCIVSVLNRNIQAKADGTWVLPNIPANFGRVRARAIVSALLATPATTSSAVKPEGASTGAPGSPALVTRADTPMPPGYAGISLGMSQQQLLQARKKIGPSAFGGDNVGHPKMLFEPGDAVTADQVIFLFDAAAPVLTGVIFVKTLDPRSTVQAVQDFRSKVVDQWGLPTQVGTTRDESGDAQTSLVWRLSNSLVIASYPNDLNSGCRAVSSLRIGQLQSEIAAFADHMPALDADTSRALMNQLRAVH